MKGEWLYLQSHVSPGAGDKVPTYWGGCCRVEGRGGPAAAGRGVPEPSVPSAASVALRAEMPSNNTLVALAALY